MMNENKDGVDAKRYTVDELRSKYLDSQPEENVSSKNKESLLMLYANEYKRNYNLKKQHRRFMDRLTKYFYVRKSSHIFSSSTSGSGNNNKNEIPQTNSSANISNSQERYRRYVLEHMKQRKYLSQKIKEHSEEFAELQKKLNAKRTEVQDLSDNLLKYKIQIAKNAQNSRSGKKICGTKIAEYSKMSKKKEKVLRQIRTKYLLLLSRKEGIDSSLKNKEFHNGLHLIDFEQYKMENAQLNDKIEEKNEALQKSKLKATETVHILTHVNEKLQFIKEKDKQLKKKLFSLEEKLKENKDYLTQLKKERDAFKNHNQHLKDTNPLIGNNALLEDYENRKIELEQLKIKLKTLQTQHSVHTKKTNDYKNKIGAIERQINKYENSGYKIRKGGLLPFF